jgi:4-amino-4-deoxychorismate lyase
LSSIIINGIETDQISVLDRGFQYGDGLFETIRVIKGQPQYWQEHISRLMAGCERLKISFAELPSLQNEAKKLCEQVNDGVLKITITRGEGGRGYTISQALEANRVLAIFPVPNYPDECWTSGVSIRVCDTRLGENAALAGIKHLNRLEQVLARAEWNDPDIREGLMMDSHNNVIEGTMSNLFAVKENEVLTPDLSRCGIKGIMREQIMRIATDEGLVTREKDLTLDELYQSDELFVCNSLIGLWPVKQLQLHRFAIGPVSQRLQKALNGIVYAA